MNDKSKEFLENAIHHIDINLPSSSTYKIKYLFRFLLTQNEELEKRVAYLEAKMVHFYDEEQQMSNFFMLFLICYLISRIMTFLFIQRLTEKLLKMAVAGYVYL